MDDSIQQLLQQVESSEGSIRDDALLTLSFLFEYNRFVDPDNQRRGYYSNYLSDALLNLRVTTEEERIIVQSLVKIVKEHDHFQTTGFFGTIGRASPSIAVEALLNLIHDFPEKFEPMVAHQAMTFLTNNLGRDDDWKPIPEIVLILRLQNPIPFFSRVLATSDHKEALYMAQVAIAAVTKYLNDAD